MDQLSLNFINLKPNGCGYTIYLRSVGGYSGLFERVAKKFSQGRKYGSTRSLESSFYHFRSN